MEQIILGGAISLISAISVIIIQHFLEIRKTMFQIKDYPRTVLYNKQVQFIESVDPLLLPINEYISMVSLMLDGTIPSSKKETIQYIRKNHFVVKLDACLDKYSPFLPSSIVRTVSTLTQECYMLLDTPSIERTSKCIDAWFVASNELRKLMGVDKLSDDFMKALGQRKIKKKKHDEYRSTSH